MVTSTDNSAVARACNVLILAVKPHIVPPVLAQIAKQITKDHLVISIAAGALSFTRNLTLHCCRRDAAEHGGAVAAGHAAGARDAQHARAGRARRLCLRARSDGDQSRQRPRQAHLPKHRRRSVLCCCPCNKHT